MHTAMDFIPTYVIAAIAGTDYLLLFVLCGACGILAGIFGALVPDHHLS